MTPESQRHARVSDLFQSALEQPHEERQMFLAQACQDDSQLLDEIQALLAIDAEGDAAVLSNTTTPEGCSLQDRVTCIGPYKVIGELGRGSMGIVYRAEDPDIRREVAIKIIQLRPSADPAERAQLRDRFLREARAAGSLSHPGIVTVYQLGEHEGQPYIVMELIDGGSLEQYLQVHSVDRVQQEALLEGLRVVAGALDYAHSRAIVHRDIKPGNILITGAGLMTGAGVLKVADFGIAKVLNESDSFGTRGLIGAPLYLAPEQLRGSPASAQSDQYALGVTAYQIVTRQKPYGAGTTEELLYQIVSVSPRPASSLNGDLHASVDPILQRVLSKDPAKRFRTCQEFVTALHEAIQRPVTTRRARFERRHWMGLALVAALCLIVLAVYETFMSAPGKAAANDTNASRATRTQAPISSSTPIQPRATAGPKKAAPGAEAVDFNGTWKADVSYGKIWAPPLDQPQHETFQLMVTGGEVMGNASLLELARTISDGRVNGRNISFVTKFPLSEGIQENQYRGTISGDQIRFTYQDASDGGLIPFTATRVRR